MDIADILAMVFAFGVLLFSFVRTVLALLYPDKYRRSRQNSSGDDLFDSQDLDEDDFDEEVEQEHVIVQHRPVGVSKNNRVPVVTQAPVQAPVQGPVNVRRHRESFVPSLPPKQLPPQERFTGEKFAFETKMDDYTQKTAIDDRHLTIGLRPGSELISDAVRLGEGKVVSTQKRAPIRDLIDSLPSKKLLWISHEVIDKPVCMRSCAFPWNR